MLGQHEHRQLQLLQVEMRHSVPLSKCRFAGSKPRKARASVGWCIDDDDRDALLSQEPSIANEKALVSPVSRAAVSLWNSCRCAENVQDSEARWQKGDRSV